jgi:hypothetical protein
MTTTTVRKEIWFTTTKNGRRIAWFYCFAAMRAMRMPLVDAELAIASGQATQVERPWIVGGAR